MNVNSLWFGFVLLFFASLLEAQSEQVKKIKQNEYREEALTLNEALFSYKNYTELSLLYDAQVQDLESKGIKFTVVEKTHKSSGLYSGGACAHSAGCVIVIPFYLWESWKSWESRTEVHAVTFNVGGHNYALEYLQESGLLLRGNISQSSEKNGEPTSRFYARYYNELGIGYVYSDEHYDSFKKEFLKDITQSIHDVNNELDSVQLVDELMSVETNHDDIIKNYLFEFDDPEVQSKLVLETCHTLNDPKYYPKVDKLVNLSNRHVIQALLTCISRESHAENNKELISSIVNEFLKHFCNHTKSYLTYLMPLKSLLEDGSYQINEQSYQCENKGAVVALEYLQEKQISVDDYFLIYEMYGESGLSFFRDHLTEKNEAYPENINFRLLLAKRTLDYWVGGNLPKPFFTFSGYKSFHNYIDSGLSSEHASYLVDYYMSGIYEDKKNLLSQLVNEDIRRQSDFLEMVVWLDKDTKLSMLKQLEVQRNGEWSILSYALHIVLSGQYDVALLKKMRASFGNKIDYITNAKDVSKRLDRKGVASAEILVVAMHLIGDDESTIRSALNIKVSLSDKLKKKSKEALKKLEES